MKKILSYFVVVFIFGILAMLAVRFIFSGPEDTWLCENGQWTKHGQPTAAMPTSGCDN